MRGTQAEYQREAINRRAKAMAIAQPFFLIEASKGYAGLDMEPYDLRRVCLVLLDEIILQMGGMRQGATIEELLVAVRPVLTASTPNITPEAADRITSYVLDGLTNEKQRQAFRTPYQIQEANGELAWKVATFKLVDVRESPVDSQIVFFASAEAINFFLAALEVDIEAEQAARDAAREYFMKHGRFEEAAMVAEENRKRTIQFRVKILQALATIERNIDDVNFVGDVLPTLDRAREHIQSRLHVENAQKQDVEMRMEEATREPLKHLAAMLSIFNSSIAYNTALLSDVQVADGRYLNEQARQKFRTRIGWEFPDPYQDVLRPILLSSVHDVWAWMGGNWHLFGPLDLPECPTFPDLIELLLQDAQNQGEVADPRADEGEQRPHPTRFSEAAAASCEALLAAMPTTFTLSDLLQEGRRRNVSHSVQTLAALRCVQSFEPRVDLRADALGRPLSDAAFVGDDLRVQKGPA